MFFKFCKSCQFLKSTKLSRAIPRSGYHPYLPYTRYHLFCTYYQKCIDDIRTCDFGVIKDD